MVQVGFVAGSVSAALLNLPDRFEPRWLIAGSAIAAGVANLGLLLASGLSNKEVAARTGRSEPAIRGKRQRLAREASVPAAAATVDIKEQFISREPLPFGRIPMNLVDGDGCDSNCKLTACGNGIVTTGELCDDGNRVNGDSCDNNCTPTGCGNGIQTTGEACDEFRGRKLNRSRSSR